MGLIHFSVSEFQILVSLSLEIRFIFILIKGGSCIHSVFMINIFKKTFLTKKIKLYICFQLVRQDVYQI